MNILCLRTIELQTIIQTISASLPELAGVSLLLFCIFLLFGIVGLQTMSGPLLHSRCRITPYPVTLSWSPDVPLQNVSSYRCRDVDNVNTRYGSSFDKASSPWKEAADNCFWPLDDEDTRLCGFSQLGLHDCIHDTERIPQEQWRWCGSNYDGFGNARFTDKMLMRSATFLEDFNFGYSNFDNIGFAVLTGFQCVTMEGWSSVMYMLQDATSPQAVAIFFVLLEIFGAFGLVNIVLAVLSNHFNTAISSGKVRLSSIRLSLSQKHHLLGQLKKKKHRNAYRQKLSKILKSDAFTNSITALIVLNAAVLAMDHYPSTADFDFGLETTNVMFTLMFCLEMVLKLGGFGFREYARSNLNLFDAAVVLISLGELIFTPPVLFGGKPSSGGGAVTALRCFRIFRVFKVFSRWTKMKILIKRIVNIVLQTLNLVILLFLFLFINTLLGMQFFANAFRFDDNGYVISDIGSAEWKNAPDRPRSNFDDFSHSFATVFQILTTENWNNIMYDCWRSRGAGAIAFVILNIIIGNYFLINLFLAIILNQFSADSDDALPKTAEDDNLYAPESMRSLSSKESGAVTSQRSLAGSGGNSAPVSSQCGAKIADIGTFGSAGSIPGGNITDSNHVASVQNSMEQVDSPRIEPFELGDCPIPSTEIASHPLSQKMPSTEEDDVSSKGSLDVLDEEVTLTEHVAVNVALNSDEVLNLISGQPWPSLFLLWVGTGAKIAASTENASGPSIKDGSVPPRRIKEVPDSLWMTASNPIRIVVAKIIKLEHFDNFVIIAILISCISLAMDNPLLNPEDAMPRVLAVIDLVILYIFIIEMILKIVVYGLIAAPTAYLRQGWNQLDVIVIFTSLIDLLLTGSGLDSLRALRALRALRPLRALRAMRAIRAMRALRPLRLVNRSAGLKVVINTLFSSIPDVTNVFILCFIFYFIFAIIGVNYFKGGMRACQGYQFDNTISAEPLYLDMLMRPLPWSHLSNSEKDLFGYHSPLYANPSNDCTRGENYSWPLVDQPCCPMYSSSSSDVTSKDICLCWNAVWAKQNAYSFDNVIEGLFTLFQMSTTEGWVDAMYSIVDFRAIDMQPKRDHTIGWIYFCVLFMIIGSFFALNIFVGVVVNNFSVTKKRDLQESKFGRGQSSFMTQRQQAWVETHALLATISPMKVIQRPTNRWRGNAFDLSETRAFNYFISTCIFLNTVVMGMHYFGESDLYLYVLETMNLAFCCVFTMEVIVKCFAYGRSFSDDYANIFDLIVVVAIDIGLVVYFIGGSRFGTTVSILQALRLAKLLKFISSTGSVGTILETVIQTLPSMGNISLLMGLLFFIYTVMGINIFAKVQFGQYYNQHANFRDFGTGFLLLFRAATGESWNYVMGDMAKSDSSSCVSDPEYDGSYCGFSNHVGCIPLNGCGSVLAYPYFVSFTVIMSLVFINLFIGIILEGFESANDLHCAVTSTDIKAFMKHWSTYDPAGSFFITSNQLEHFLYTLPDSLKRNKKEFSTIKMIRKFVSTSNIKVFDQGKVHFRDVLVEISKHYLLQLTEEELRGTITEEDNLDLFREHLSTTEAIVAVNSVRRLFSASSRNSGSPALTHQTNSTFIARSMREQYAARMLLHHLRRAVYMRKRSNARLQLKSNSGITPPELLGSIEPERDETKDYDSGYEIFLPTDYDVACEGSSILAIEVQDSVGQQDHRTLDAESKGDDIQQSQKSDNLESDLLHPIEKIEVPDRHMNTLTPLFPPATRIDFLSPKKGVNHCVPQNVGAVENVILSISLDRETAVIPTDLVIALPKSPSIVQIPEESVDAPMSAYAVDSSPKAEPHQVVAVANFAQSDTAHAELACGEIPDESSIINANYECYKRQEVSDSSVALDNSIALDPEMNLYHVSPMVAHNHFNNSSLRESPQEKKSSSRCVNCPTESDIASLHLKDKNDIHGSIFISSQDILHARSGDKLVEEDLFKLSPQEQLALLQLQHEESGTYDADIYAVHTDGSGNTLEKSVSSGPVEIENYADLQIASILQQDGDDIYDF